jgi:predicted transcriptional regulator
MAASQAGAEAAADSAPVLASSSEGAAVAVATNPATAIMIGAVVAAIPDGVVVDAWWKRLFVGIAGYTRLMRNRLLDMENRNRLHDFVRAHPGAATRTVMVEGRFSRSTTVYHLRVLEREGFIVSRLVGRTRFWYPVGQSGLISQEALALLQHPTAQAIASTVATEPGISQVDLCRRLGLGASLVHWHVTRLETAGAIMRAPESRRPVYLPASGLSQALNAAAVATRRSFAG